MFSTDVVRLLREITRVWNALRTRQKTRAQDNVIPCVPVLSALAFRLFTRNTRRTWRRFKQQCPRSDDMVTRVAPLVSVCDTATRVRRFIAYYSFCPWSRIERTLNTGQDIRPVVRPTGGTPNDFFQTDTRQSVRLTLLRVSAQDYFKTHHKYVDQAQSFLLLHWPSV